ncbi:MAG: VWA domain-containing protein [Pyrinomonadaceae bacterium]
MVNYRFARRVFPQTIATAVLALAIIAWAASAADAQVVNDDDPITVDSALVRLNVGVVDRRGRPILDLGMNNFAVYEDNVKQKIDNFEMTTAPFSLVMLLDVSGSTKQFRQNLQLAAKRFLDALGPEDRVCIVAFSKKVEALSGFTSDRKDLYYAIDIADGKGETDLYKALQFSLDKLKGQGKRRKAIVVLTDGGDTSMKVEDRLAVGRSSTVDEAVGSIKPEKSAILQQVLNAADRQFVTIYPLALPTGDPKRLPDPSPLQIALFTAARARLQIMADRTGGRLNAINNLEDMSRLYGEVAADLRTLYTVTYQSSNVGVKRPDRWRDIRIELDKPDLLARTRQGYYVR